MQLPRYFPSPEHILVCTGPSCLSRASGEVFNQTWKLLEEQGIAYYQSGGSVRLTESGCLGACNFGPTVLAYFRNEKNELREAWFAGMNASDLLSLASALRQKNVLAGSLLEKCFGRG